MCLQIVPMGRNSLLLFCWVVVFALSASTDYILVASGAVDRLQLFSWSRAQP
jgi:hypothetical protein